MTKVYLCYKPTKYIIKNKHVIRKNVGDVFISSTKLDDRFFIECNGQILNKKYYPELYDVIGLNYSTKTKELSTIQKFLNIFEFDFKHEKIFLCDVANDEFCVPFIEYNEFDNKN